MAKELSIAPRITGCAPAASVCTCDLSSDLLKMKKIQLHTCKIFLFAQRNKLNMSDKMEQWLRVFTMQLNTCYFIRSASGVNIFSGSVLMERNLISLFHNKVLL